MWLRMKNNAPLILVLAVAALSLTAAAPSFPSQNVDIRGLWVGKAEGSIFGAEGTLNITSQKGEDVYGIIEGGNTFGKAKFSVKGKIQGNMIFASKEGHTFQGQVLGDGTIRGIFRASDGSTFRVFLRRPDPYWGSIPGQMPYGQFPYGQFPYGDMPYYQMPYGQEPYGPYQPQ